MVGERLTGSTALFLAPRKQRPSHWDVLVFLRAAGFEPYGFSSLSRDDESNLIEYDALFARHA